MIKSTPKVGTRVDVNFQRSHIDRMPLGNLPETYLSLLVGCPEIHWRFYYSVDNRVFDFDDALIKQELEGIPLSEPAILAYLRDLIYGGIKEIQQSLQTA